MKKFEVSCHKTPTCSLNEVWNSSKHEIPKERKIRSDGENVGEIG
jgi:hypothetical protein